MSPEVDLLENGSDPSSLIFVIEIINSVQSLLATK